MKSNHELSLAFGTVLERNRKSLGIAQDKLALKADLDRTFVGRIARGALNPSLESIFKLAGALEMNPEELIRQVSDELNAVTGNGATSMGFPADTKTTP